MCQNRFQHIPSRLVFSPHQPMKFNSWYGISQKKSKWMPQPFRPKSWKVSACWLVVLPHDFNNILAGLLAQATLTRRKLEQGKPALLNLNKVILSAERAADLTRQLLAYAGRGKFQVDALDLNQLVHDTMTLLETNLAGRARLKLNLETQLPLLQADRGQLQQVVMNLVINAVEALKDHDGEVKISTTLETMVSPPTLNGYMATDLPPGRYVKLEVRDNGFGMEQATLQRIFDPYFSTKSSGHGLGLSAILGIIRSHQGGLHVESQPGIGTTFMILLPVAPAVDSQATRTDDDKTDATADIVLRDNVNPPKQCSACHR